MLSISKCLSSDWLGTQPKMIKESKAKYQKSEEKTFTKEDKLLTIETNDISLVIIQLHD